MKTEQQIVETEKQTEIFAWVRRYFCIKLRKIMWIDHVIEFSLFISRLVDTEFMIVVFLSIGQI